MKKKVFYERKKVFIKSSLRIVVSHFQAILQEPCKMPSARRSDLVSLTLLRKSLRTPIKRVEFTNHLVFNYFT